MNGLLISRLGEISVTVLPEKDDYFKKCGFRNPEGFGLQATWNVGDLEICLYAKTIGKSNSENKFEFPPPVDKALYFGKCLLVSPGKVLIPEQWKSAYETLLGGIETLVEEEASEDEEEEGEKTKEGYLKDDFVVSDSELEEEPYV